MSESQPSGPLRLVFGLLKGLCIVAGLPLTVVGLMALVGLLTANGWARLAIGVVVAIGLPLFIVDRVLPDSDQTKVRGLATDLLALIWVVFPLAFFGLAHGVTKNSTAVEADRLAAAGWQRTAQATYWLASVEPVASGLAKAKGASSQPTKVGAKKADAKKADAKKADAKKADAKKADAKKADAKTAKKADAKKADAKKADAKKADAKKADAKPSKLSPAEIFARYAPAVVSIRTNRGSGTGFVIDDIGTIATNRHVIKGATRAQIKLKSGAWVRKVELLEINKDIDLALLRITLPKAVKPVVLGVVKKLKVGERVIAIGNPLGLEHTLTDGLVSQRRILRGKRWIQMSTPISPGNSGGPVFNLEGQVIGVATATIGGLFRRAQNLNLAVPVDELKKMIKTDYPKRRPFGADAPQTW
jgi:serine protease Do